MESHLWDSVAIQFIQLLSDTAGFAPVTCVGHAVCSNAVMPLALLVKTAPSGGCLYVGPSVQASKSTWAN